MSTCEVMKKINEAYQTSIFLQLPRITSIEYAPETSDVKKEEIFMLCQKTVASLLNWHVRELGKKMPEAKRVCVPSVKMSERQKQNDTLYQYTYQYIEEQMDISYRNCSQYDTVLLPLFTNKHANMAFMLRTDNHKEGKKGKWVCYHYEPNCVPPHEQLQDMTGDAWDDIFDRARREHYHNKDLMKRRSDQNYFEQHGHWPHYDTTDSESDSDNLDLEQERIVLSSSSTGTSIHTKVCNLCEGCKGICTLLSWYVPMKYLTNKDGRQDPQGALDNLTKALDDEKEMLKFLNEMLLFLQRFQSVTQGFKNSLLSILKDRAKKHGQFSDFIKYTRSIEVAFADEKISYSLPQKLPTCS